MFAILVCDAHTWPRRSVKNMIILIAVAIVIGIGGVAAFYTVKALGGVTEEASEFAATHDQNECLAESLQRLSRCGWSVPCQANALAFSHACIPRARRSAEMCRGVPRGIFDIALWTETQCGGTDLPQKACTRIYRKVATTCLAQAPVQPDAPPSPASQARETGAALGRIAVIDATVTGLRFFESGIDGVPKDERSYQQRFEASEARYINWELNLKFPPVPGDTSFEIDAVYYRPGGGVLGRLTHPARVEAGWTYSWHNRSWGWDAPGHWPRGEYRVELHVDGAKIAAEGFAID